MQKEVPFVEIDDSNFRRLKDIFRENLSIGTRAMKLRYGVSDIYSVMEVSGYISPALYYAKMNGMSIYTIPPRFDVPEGLSLDMKESRLVFHRNRRDAGNAATVIIPTYNRKESLKLCVRSLLEQDFDMSKVEVIIIDDGSDDDSAECIRSMEIPLNISYYYWPRKVKLGKDSFVNRAGPSRNIGIIKSTGRILIFLDSDMVADRSLVGSHIRANLSADLKGVVLGIRKLLGKPIEDFGDKLSAVSRIDPRIESLYEECKWNLNSLERPWIAFTSNNFSVSKTVLKSVGLFRKDFIMWGGEDIDLAYRVNKQGFVFALEANAVAYHLPHDTEYNDRDEHIRLFSGLMYKIYLDRDILEVFRNYHV